MYLMIKKMHSIFVGYGGTLRYRLLWDFLGLLIRNRWMHAQSSGVTSIAGKRMVYSNRASLYGMFVEIFIDQNYYLEQTDAPLVIIDCGSNIGMSLLYFATRAPQARITSFEPNPHTFGILMQNIDQNDFLVEAKNIGLGAFVGTATLNTDVYDMASQSASVTRHLESKGRPLQTVQIEIQKLSSYIVASVDILKLDIEWLEGEVVEDLVESGAIMHVKTMFIEYHYDGVHTVYPLGNLLSNLERSGFIYVIESPIQFPYTARTRPSYLSYKIVAWRI